MAFSPDRAYLAVGYRGYPTSVWNLEAGRSIAKCRRVADRRRNIVNAWSPIDRITWHPRTGELLGRYDDGCVFKWHPLEEDSQEVRAQASELQISADGNLFITSDISGCIKIWNYEHFALIYQLSCDNGIIGLCFSPDSKRFYDVNGSVCNVWEPNALIRLFETDEKGSEKESDVSSTTGTPLGASQAFAELLDPITALACTSEGSTYCSGNDAGNVQLRYGNSDAVIDVFRSGRYLLIDTIACSPDGSSIAFQELGGQIQVYRTLRPGRNSSKLSRILEIKLMDGLQQLMFGPDAKQLLISSKSSAQLWSLDTLSHVSTYVFKEHDHARYWLNNPVDKTSFMLATVDRIEVFTKNTLQKITQVAIDSSPGTDAILDHPNGNLDPEKRPSIAHLPSSSNTSIPQRGITEDELTQAMITQDQQHVLLVIRNARRQQRSFARQRLAIIPISALRTASGSLPTQVSWSALPTSLAEQIQVPLGVLSQNRLVFIDNNYWICTYKLDELARPRSSFGSLGESTKTESTSLASLQRHFFLPRDWLNVDCLELCQVTSDGTFLCPRKGEVAVIKSDLGRAW